MPAVPRTTASLLRQCAADRGDNVALVLDGVGHLTYAQWYEQSCSTANGLVALGVRPGQRVVVPVEGDWLEYAVAYMAVHLAAAVAVPVPASLGNESIARVAVASSAVGVLGAEPVQGVAIWQRSVSDLAKGYDPSAPTVEPTPDDDAEILFTSGTTGVPKGVVATHSNLTHTATRSWDGERRTVLHALPPASNGGQSLMMQALSPSPHTVVTMPRFDASRFLVLIEQHRPEVLVLAPAFAIALLRLPDGHDLSSVRLVRSTSAPITPSTLAALARRFPQATVVNLYTSTEAWPARASMSYDPSRPGALGRVEDGERLTVVTADGRPAEPGVAGDVLLRSGGSQRRYLDDAAATGSVFLDGGWVRTGDVGLLDQDGYLYLRDRRDDSVNSGGRNISTIEAQNALAEHPLVQEAVAFSMPHPVLGQYMVAAAILTPGTQASSAELVGFVGSKIGPANAPKRVLVVDDLPRNALGKVIKSQLRELVESSVEDQAPSTPMQVAAARIWGSLLGVEPETISLQSDWLALGGSSLEAAAASVMVAEELGLEVAERVLNSSPTLEEFATALESAPAVGSTTYDDVPRLARS